MPRRRSGLHNTESADRIRLPTASVRIRSTGWGCSSPARRVAPFSRRMHALGLRVGVIIGGGVSDPHDETWVAHGLEHVRELASDQAAEPDDFVVQSWQNLPTRMLPETSPGTATFELLQSESIAR